MSVLHKSTKSDLVHEDSVQISVAEMSSVCYDLSNDPVHPRGYTTVSPVFLQKTHPLTFFSLTPQGYLKGLKVSKCGDAEPSYASISDASTQIHQAPMS